jgi:hypothetical protein
MSDQTYVPTQDQVDAAQERLGSMSPEDLLGLELYQEQLEKRLNELSLSEAGGSITGLLYSKNTGNSWQVTARGVSLREAVDNLMDGIVYAVKDLGAFIADDPKKTAAQTIGTPVPTSAPAPGTRPSVPAPGVTLVPAPAPAQSAPAPTTSVSPNTGDIPCVAIVSTPQAGGKVKLEFYGNDKVQPRNRYASIYGVFTMERALKVLEPLNFQPEHLGVAADYEIPCVVSWRKGKPNNSKLGYYQDIESVKPA